MSNPYQPIIVAMKLPDAVGWCQKPATGREKKTTVRHLNPSPPPRVKCEMANWFGTAHTHCGPGHCCGHLDLLSHSVFVVVRGYQIKEEDRRGFGKPLLHCGPHDQFWPCPKQHYVTCTVTPFQPTTSPGMRTVCCIKAFVNGGVNPMITSNDRNNDGRDGHEKSGRWAIRIPFTMLVIHFIILLAGRWRTNDPRMQHLKRVADKVDAYTTTQA